jgi:Na+/melibiose symporter-like transporter
MAQKLVNALAVAIALPLLSLAGFDPAGPNNGLAREMVRIAYLALPAPLFLIGAILFWRFPLDGRRHRIVRRRLAGTGLAAAGPLP